MAFAWLAMLLVLYEYYNNAEFVAFLNTLPAWANYAVLGVYILFIFVTTTDYMMRAERPLRQEFPLLSRLRIMGSSLNLVLTIYAVALVLYAVGIVGALVNLFQTRVFPELNSFISWVLANIVGWMLSGVIGRLAFEGLRLIAWRSLGLDKSARNR